VAKKKSQKRPAPPGVDPNEKRRERLEAKRIAKAQALAAKRKREARERIMRRVALLALLGFAVWFLFLRTATPDEINGNPINDFSTAGANQHVSGTVPYQDSPPVSGQHAPQPTFCGVHSAPIPNETMVHNLEHGAIGLLYAPDTDPEDIQTLESIVGDYEDNVFSMPYQGQMDSPIVIAAWGHTMELDTAEEDSVRQFIEEFRHGGDAPEANQVCEHQDPQPFDATPAPQETPTPTPTQGGRNRTPEPTPSS
jgi:hypothetical protein